MNQYEMFENAKWVCTGAESSTPFIRGSFTAHDVKSASITIVGFGFFELYINGIKVGNEMFVPLNTDFHDRKFRIKDKVFDEKTAHRIYCPQYDIFDYIKEGKNQICVMLGPGWYSSKKVIGFSEVKLCFKIELFDDNGNRSLVISDENLKWTQGYVFESELLTGEMHDYKYANDGWMDADFDDGNWVKMQATQVPETNYYIQSSPADKIIKHIPPKLIKETEDVKIYDIGENTTGYPVIFCNSSSCERVIVRFSEEITDEGSLNEEQHYRQKTEFVTDGKPRYMHTRFTWHGFRYFEVTNNAIAVDCIVIHADVDVTSAFESNNKTLNWLYNAFIRTQLSNMHSGIPSDCPHVERRGYTGDGQLSCRSAMLMLDGESFYKKWIYDISDCQDRLSGHVQYTAPYTHSGGGPGGWGCAIVVVPYVHYKHYGNIAILRELYPQMLCFFDYLEEHSENDLVISDREGEWCLGDWCTPQPIVIPEPLVNNYFYIKSIDLVLKISKIIGNTNDYDMLQTRILKRKEAILKAYYDEQTGDFANNVQGANAFAVDIGLGDERTYQNIINYYRNLGMYDTGIFGTDILTRILFERGEGELAFSLMTSNKETSYNTFIKKGATTIWENWNGKRSHNHPMFGAVTEYLFTYILGIKQTEDSIGYEKVEISPAKINDLEYAKGYITTKSGMIGVEYSKMDNQISFVISLNSKTIAEFRYGNFLKKLHSGKNIILLKA